MAQHPSDVKITGPSYYMTSFAANYATTVLTTIVGRPNHAAQIVEFFNAGTATENAVFLDVNGTQHSEPVAAVTRYSPPMAVSSIHTDSGINVSAKAYWWPALGFTLNV